MIYAGCASLFGLGLEDGHVATFWLLLHFLSQARYLRDPRVLWNPMMHGLEEPRKAHVSLGLGKCSYVVLRF